MAYKITYDDMVADVVTALKQLSADAEEEYVREQLDRVITDLQGDYNELRGLPRDRGGDVYE